MYYRYFLINSYILVSTGLSATARASSRRAESQQHLDRVGTPSIEREAGERPIKLQGTVRLQVRMSPTAFSGSAILSVEVKQTLRNLVTSRRGR